jgi:hypothetical protein
LDLKQGIAEVRIARGGQKKINWRAKLTNATKIHKATGKNQQNKKQAAHNPARKFGKDSNILPS